MEKVNKLVKMATELRPAERIKLAEEILKSLDAIDPEIEKNWIAESESRYSAYKKGELKAVDWEQLKKRHAR